MAEDIRLLAVMSVVSAGIPAGVQAFSVILSVVLVAVACGLFVACWPLLRRTTLAAPLAWALVAVFLVAAVELGIGVLAARSSPWTSPLRFLVATSTFCPTTALLGAKRPQDRAWQFVVVSLWGILALPAAQALALGHDIEGGARDLRSWFLVLLLAVSLSNALGTRLWPSALLYVCGQTLLLAACLPGGHLLANWFSEGGESGVVGLPLGALSLMVLAGLVAAWRAPAARSRSPAGSAVASLDRLWLDFRNVFGTLWSLRVMQRMNAAGHLEERGIQLTWWGFRRRDGGPLPGELPLETRRVVEQMLTNLLRRFVSLDWIASRLGRTVD